MWKGTLHAGDAAIPIKLYSAIEDRTVRFHILEASSEERVEQRMVDPESEEEAPREDVRKGYEIEPGTYVTLDPEELRSVEPPPSRDVLTMSFVPAEKVGPQWYERPYYLGPDGDSDSYFALAKALEDSQREGVVQWVMRKRQYYGALRGSGGYLLLFSLRNTEEVLSAQELPAPGKPADGRELKMAEQLIHALEGEFHAEDYRDEYRERLEQFLEQKAKGRAPRLRAVSRKKEPESLMTSLEASLKALKKKGGKAVA
jgi:DNA end-binding protein Ku